MIASFYWNRVSNTAFSAAVLTALAVFFPVRFGWIALSGPVAILTDLLAVIGVGVIAGLMAFGFFGLRVGIAAAVVVAMAVLPFGMGFLHLYPVLTASLLAYAISTVLCVGISLTTTERFDFARIAEETGRFDKSPAQS